mmetsp:Transcript_12877/g.26383  ORF Transcript_12877/g.26383 Transcript_12877/m.26383 type:complete len:237 (+) Transcript_12877:431-1141(+)
MPTSATSFASSCPSSPAMSSSIKNFMGRLKPAHAVSSCLASCSPSVTGSLWRGRGRLMSPIMCLWMLLLTASAGVYLAFVISRTSWYILVSVKISFLCSWCSSSPVASGSFCPATKVIPLSLDGIVFKGSGGRPATPPSSPAWSTLFCSASPSTCFSSSATSLMTASTDFVLKRPIVAKALRFSCLSARLPSPYAMSFLLALIPAQWLKANQLHSSTSTSLSAPTAISSIEFRSLL